MFASFLVLHLFNTMSAVLGQSVYDSVQRALRWYYQFPIVEIVCVAGAAIIHIWAGVTRIWRRRGRERGSVPLRLRLHRWSAYYLLVFITGHVLATRGTSLFLDTKPDLAFLSYSFVIAPKFFYPYYTLLFACGLYHLAHGSLNALRLFGVQARVTPRAFRWAVSTGVAAGLAAVLAIAGHFFDIDTRRYAEFHALAQRFYPKSMVPAAPAPKRQAVTVAGPAANRE
jgi:hypothetical protein